MKKIFKKIGMCVMAVMLVFGAGITLTACKDDPGPTTENQVMTLSVNPSVEFIVDNDDKVISVSASNEDGAYILEKFTEFTGMTAKDAALKFLELCEENNFVVSGFTDGQEFTISVSGNGADSLYNDVKAKVTSKASELGLAVGDLVKVTKDNLEAVVAECYQEYSSTRINAMSEKELIEAIKASREETKDIHTEDEKARILSRKSKTNYQRKNRCS